MSVSNLLWVHEAVIGSDIGDLYGTVTVGSESGRVGFRRVRHGVSWWGKL